MSKMQCKCTTKKGTRCTKTVVKGEKYCYMHLNSCEGADKAAPKKAPSKKAPSKKAAPKKAAPKKAPSKKVVVKKSTHFPTHLDFSKNPDFDDDALIKMVKSGELFAVTSLNLANTQIGDDGVKALLRTNIKILNLKNTKVTDIGLMALAKSPTLTDINLEGTALSNPAFNAFLSNEGIRNIWFQGLVTDEDRLWYKERKRHASK
jgi:hypothetical protein